MEEIARVYARALFDVAKENGTLDEIHDQLGQFADSVSSSEEMQVFFFSPYFTSAEKREAIASAVSGADGKLVNFLELLAEKHRMPVIFAIRRAFDELWAEERKRLDVTVTSAVELDRAIVEKVGRRDREADRPRGRSQRRGRRGRHRRPRPASGQPRARRERAAEARQASQGNRTGRCGLRSFSSESSM